jgi:acyl-CoA thioesterase-1
VKNQTRILLLGDSTLITTYLPEDDMFSRALERELKTLGLEAEIFNAADNGEFIARYLLSGAYERMRARQHGADIIVVRFGVNDEKRVPAWEFGRHLEILLDLLDEDFPGARIILETGIYMDPEHYFRDRNQTLIPYWQKTREIAAGRGHMLCDVYAAMERETAKGNWDLRIRRNMPDGSRALDASQDTGREHDKVWFTDVHPNAKGTRLAAGELARCLAEAFPNGFPSGQARRQRNAKSAQEYSDLLAFAPERLLAPANPAWRPGGQTATDDLQNALNPTDKKTL